MNPIPKVSLAILFCVTHLAMAEKAEQFVIKPSKGDGPFPVALWLHGYRGYSPDGYFPGGKPAALQKHADTIGAVIIGFPATTDLGDDTQQWSEEPVADHAYIQDRLLQISKTVNLDLKRVALFGFSQGAMVAGDLASIYPDYYAGAILMSPGGMGNPRPTGVKSAKHAEQTYFCFCGAKEHEGNVELTKAYGTHFKDVLGAKTTTKLYPGVEKHTRPPDFMKQFPLWIKAILDVAADPKKRAEQGDADQPAAIVDSKVEGNEKAKPESEGRSQ